MPPGCDWRCAISTLEIADEPADRDRGDRYNDPQKNADRSEYQCGTGIVFSVYVARSESPDEKKYDPHNGNA
jgi:hypothetical protein